MKKNTLFFILFTLAAFGMAAFISTGRASPIIMSPNPPPLITTTSNFTMRFLGDNFYVNNSQDWVNITLAVRYNNITYQVGDVAIKALLALNGSTSNISTKTYKYGFNFTIPLSVTLGQPLYFVLQINSSESILISSGYQMYSGPFFLNYSDVDPSMNPNLTMVNATSAQFTISRTNFTQGERIRIDPTIIYVTPSNNVQTLAPPRISLIRDKTNTFWAPIVNLSAGNLSLYKSTDNGNSWSFMASFIDTTVLTDSSGRVNIFPDNNSDAIHVFYDLTTGSSGSKYRKFNTTNSKFGAEINSSQNTVAPSYVYNAYNNLFEFRFSGGILGINYTNDQGKTWRGGNLFPTQGNFNPTWAYSVKFTNDTMYGAIINDTQLGLFFFNVTANGSAIAMKQIDTFTGTAGETAIDVEQNGALINLVAVGKTAGPNDLSLFIYNSTDRGNTFTSRRQIANSTPTISVRNPVFVNESNMLLIFYWTNETLPSTFVINSTDGGNSWSLPQLLRNQSRDISPMHMPGFPGFLAENQTIFYLYENLTAAGTSVQITIDNFSVPASSIACTNSLFTPGIVYLLNGTINLTSSCVNQNNAPLQAVYNVDFLNYINYSTMVLNASSNTSIFFTSTNISVNFTAGPNTNYTIYLQQENQSNYEPIQISDCPSGSTIFLYNCQKIDEVGSPSLITDNYTILFKFNVTSNTLTDSAVNITAPLGWFPSIQSGTLQHIYINGTINDNITFAMNTTNVGLTIGDNFNLTIGERTARVEYQVLTVVPPPTSPGSGGGGGGGGGGSEASCGNGVCETGETASSCPADCTNITFRVVPPSVERFFARGEIYTRDFVIQNTFSQPITVTVRIHDDGDHSSQYASISNLANGTFYQQFDIIVPAGASQIVTGNAPIYMKVQIPPTAVEGNDRFTLEFVHGQRTVSVPILMHIGGSQGFFQQVLDALAALNTSIQIRPMLGISSIPVGLILVVIIIIIVLLLRSANGEKKR